MVLMLTAASAPGDRVSGLTLGADDYLAKPFHFPELVLRIQALARRKPDARPRHLHAAGISLDPVRRTAVRDGRDLDLSVKELAVLEALLLASPGYLSAETLLEKVWDENADPFTNTVAVTVGRLRRKLGEPTGDRDNARHRLSRSRSSHSSARRARKMQRTAASAGTRRWPLYHALLLTGVAGVGKSTVAAAIGGAISDTGKVVAVIDSDELAQFGPPPNDGLRRHGFYDRLKCDNVAAVWANFREAGARFVVVAAGIDSVALRTQYAVSLAGCHVQVVRLVAATEIVRLRLRGRGNQVRLIRHLDALTEQEAALDAARVDDFSVVNERPPSEVAHTIIVRAGWFGSTE